MLGVSIGPRLLLIGINRRPLVLPWTDFNISIPIGSPYILKSISWVFDRTVVASVQTSPNLSFDFFDSKGYAFSNEPIMIRNYGSPGGNRGLTSTKPLHIKYEGGDTIHLRLFGAIAGPVPAVASVTLYGYREAALRGYHGNL